MVSVAVSVGISRKPMQNLLTRFVSGLLTIAALIASSVFLFWMPSATEPPYQFVSMWGETGKERGQFRDPTGIAVTDTEVLVSDSRNGRIQVFDHDGNFLRQFSGSDLATLRRPMNLVVYKQELYVADYWQDQIFVFTLAGELIRTIGQAGSGPGQFNAPGGVAVGENGDLYVADFYNQRVQKLSASGEFIRQWGTTGKVGIFAGQLNYPTDVAILSNDTLFVADGYNDRVQVFAADGGFITKWGGPLALNIKGSINGWFQTVSSIDIDSDGFIYTADFYNNRVQIFSSDGQFITSIGGTGESAFQLDRVVAVAVAADGTVFLSNFGKNQIQKWQPGK